YRPSRPLRLSGNPFTAASLAFTLLHVKRKAFAARSFAPLKMAKAENNRKDQFKRGGNRRPIWRGTRLSRRADSSDSRGHAAGHLQWSDSDDGLRRDAR